ncbi:tRNA (carboxymethyluridine(34)-5-O)-methyltransferase ALKBH8 isoform X2 [Lycorma delicatula]|uniref:tRNA (carboxymethyluridine(34)-5-O)-methyltransferase ALKBH8 isoform X2 n=1 Tax=Lycorma delicatula TaxID=130591 RepID=UPI003F50D773
MQTSEDCNKHRRKIDRKSCKYKNILLKETGIKHAEEPTKHLMICNAGLVSGISECEVVELFSEYGSIDLTTMLFVPQVQNNSVTSLPEGLYILNDFVTEDEEELLHKCIDWSKSTSNIDKLILKHRNVKHYGYEFNYENNNVDKNSPLEESIPHKCLMLFDRLKEKGFYNIVPWIPDQLTVNEYQPGQGIPSHVDTHSPFESPIISLSLGSDVIMDFKHRDGRKVPVLLPRRSLLIMDGESRYDWSHGITPRKLDVVQSLEYGLISKERSVRTSFTFRKIHHGACHCKYPFHCDSQQTSAVISNNDASQLEAVHVHQVYEEISSHFSETRHKPWPNVANFVSSLPSGAILVDVGCGNGKYFGANRHIFEVGCDRSIHLSQECHSRGNEVFTCDCLQLPLQSCCADGVISIAVIHHLATYERRLFALKEMVRVLQIGGRGLVYVWAKDQQKGNNMSSYLKQDRKNRRKDDINNQSRSNNERTGENSDSVEVTSDISLPVHKNRTQFQHQDLLVPWKLKTNKDIIFYRYYHVFKEGELEKIFLSITDAKITKSYYDQGNWCVLFEKIK